MKLTNQFILYMSILIILVTMSLFIIEHPYITKESIQQSFIASI
jgi:hypothetical protein